MTHTTVFRDSVAYEFVFFLSSEDSFQIVAAFFPTEVSDGLFTHNDESLDPPWSLDTLIKLQFPWWSTTQKNYIVQLCDKGKLGYIYIKKTWLIHYSYFVRQAQAGLQRQLDKRTVNKTWNSSFTWASVPGLTCAEQSYPARFNFVILLGETGHRKEYTHKHTR